MFSDKNFVNIIKLKIAYRNIDGDKRDCIPILVLYQ